MTDSQIAAAYDARAAEYIAVTPAYFWTPEALAELLDQAGFVPTASTRRPRTTGEASIRPHASVTATRP